jgi:hypothetical protein
VFAELNLRIEDILNMMKNLAHNAAIYCGILNYFLALSLERKNKKKNLRFNFRYKSFQIIKKNFWLKKLLI